MKNKNFLYITFILISIITFSCKNQDLTTTATIKYGTSFGMCVDYCQREILLNGSKATFAKSKNGNNPDTKTCTKELDEVTLTALRKSIDMNAISNLPDVIGCPDCADGGSEYVEITSNGKTKKVVFEYGKTPPSLIDLVSKLKPVFQSFNDCK
ncbi:hypothetical protein FA048_11180 [Pedobacter polaris]|uniref:Lipoprotein n=1 Tax=Pedobacter polaris TaxID=2571273 RepID=A0A4U1CT36_9SPHI|nr:hypothetical protein [Pedobacter polaris]TKC10726.1 hypothetical protein FA048_11180 [Pedobacter polaris]